MVNGLSAACWRDIVRDLQPKDVEGYQGGREVAVEFQVISARSSSVITTDGLFQLYLMHRYCFMESMRRRGVLDGTSAYILDNWYNRVLLEHRSKPHVIG